MPGHPVLGILTLYLNDRKYIEEMPVYEKMTLQGRKLGLQIIVFTPEDVQDHAARIHALVYHPGKRLWGRRWMRLPNLIYDRARYQRTRRFDRLLAFRRKYPGLTFLNRPLRNKWVLYRALGQADEIRRHLPSTRLYESPDDVTRMLRRFPTVYFKPINGTGGRGILRIQRRRRGLLLLQGRNHERNIVSPRKVPRGFLSAVLRSWDMNGDRYIVQQGLDNRLPDGRVHDYRMLVQKNGSGEWEVTGCAGRVGPRKSVTSNLHGGGTAAAMATLLREWGHDDGKIGDIRHAAETLGVEVAKNLENTYGALCELALDLAVDRQGFVWLLEVNPKPAREVFLLAGERDVYRRAISLPMEYAVWVHRRQTGETEREEKEAWSGVASTIDG